MLAAIPRILPNDARIGLSPKAKQSRTHPIPLFQAWNALAELRDPPRGGEAKHDGPLLDYVPRVDLVLVDRDERGVLDLNEHLARVGSGRGDGDDVPGAGREDGDGVMGRRGGHGCHAMKCLIAREVLVLQSLIYRVSHIALRGDQSKRRSWVMSQSAFYKPHSAWTGLGPRV